MFDGLQNSPTHRAVVAARLIDADGRWLMQRRPAHKEHVGLWEFPGGKVEPGETLRHAMVREAHEELEIVLDPAALMPSAFADADGPGGIVLFLYTVRRWTGEVRSREGGELGWFAPAEAAALDTPPLDRVLLTAI